MGFMEQFSRTGQNADLSMLKALMRGDTSAAVSGVLRSNPSFANFVFNENKGKSVGEAFKSYGYDLDEVLSLINS